MLVLSRKQVTIVLIALLSFLIVMAASMAIIHATNPGLFQHVTGFVPQVWNYF